MQGLASKKQGSGCQDDLVAKLPTRTNVFISCQSVREHEHTLLGSSAWEPLEGSEELL